MYALMTKNALPKRFIDARAKPRQAEGVCTDHDDDCYTPRADGSPHDALKCWMRAPECGVCPLLAGGENDQ